MMVGVIGWLLLPARTGHGPSALTKDQAQVKEIHQSLMVFSRELDGSFPLPGLIGLADDADEDYSLNHTANLYSLMVMRHYVTPLILVSPTEPSGNILPKDDYAFEAYDPTNGVFWDPSFVMNIDDQRIGANGSYAHAAMVGDRRANVWRDTMDVAMPVFGTRGVRNGVGAGHPDYDRSLTLEFFEPFRKWVGNICFADNHTEMLDTFFPEGLTFDDGSGAKLDNIFAAEFDHPNGSQAAADAFLVICTAATQYTVTDVHDPLED
ncbi:MAG: hypothetical protein V3T53_05380 [Phycisphaerales bacterium]